MSNLVPVQRPDKNGKLVTRHVRIDDPSPAAKRGIPALAAVNPGSGLREVKSRLVDSVSAAVVFLQDQTADDLAGEDFYADRLDRYSPAALKAYDKAITENPNGGYDTFLLSILHNNLDDKAAGRLLFIGQLTGTSDSLWTQWGNGTCSYAIASGIHCGLESLDGDFGFSLPENILEADEEEAGRIAALITLTNSVYSLDGDFGIYTVNKDEWNEGFSLSNPDLIELVLEYPEQAERIGDLVYERETDDGDLIREVIESEASSLSGGVL